MEFMTTKIKIMIFLIVGSAIGFIVYYTWFRICKHVASPAAFPFTIPVDNIRKVVLSNGMHVLVFKNTSVPKVLVQLAYDVGSYVEDSGERGLAHLVEHMIFKGTQKLAESDIDTIARKYGASMNAFTSNDVTSYYFEVNKNNWTPFLVLLADCMQNVRFDEQHLASEVKAVMQELKMGKDHYWRKMIYKIHELLFPPNHPYHTSTIGFKEDLLNLHADTLKAFYKKYYRPDRATLFVVGDVDLDEAVEAAREQFEHIVVDQPKIEKTFPRLIPELVVHHTRLFEDVNHSSMCLYWLIPGFKSEDDHLASAVASLLGGGQSSRLVRLLIDEKKCASSVFVKASRLTEAGTFLILLEPLTGREEECVDLVRQEIERVAREGASKQEVGRIARQKGKRFLLKLQDFNDFVYEWIKSYFVTRDELDVFKRIAKFQDITSETIQVYTNKYLDPFLMGRIEVLPLPEGKRSLNESIKKATDALDNEILAKHQRTAPLEEPRAVHMFQKPLPLTFEFPKPTKIFTLSNGMNVTFVKNTAIPLVSMNLQFKEASFLEAAREGIKLEFMMDTLVEGSKGLTKQENVDFFETHGASFFFGASGGGVLCFRDDVEQLVERFYHILTQPTFASDALDKVKNIFVSQYARAKDSTRAMASRLLKNAIYQDHPYSWTFDDAISMIDACDKATLKKLHDSFVNPANVVLSVVGDFDESKMERCITRVFGQWQRGHEQRYEKVTHRFDPRARIEHHMVRDQVVLTLGQPSTITIYDQDLIPLKMLSIICFDSMGSRIFKLRERTGIFYTASGSFAMQATKEHGYDFVEMLVSPENVVQGEEQLRGVLSDVVNNGVTQHEVDAARQIYLKALIDLVASPSAIAALMCKVDALELGFDYYDKVLARVQSITPEELSDIARRYCSPDAMTTILVGPIDSIAQKQAATDI